MKTLVTLGGKSIVLTMADFAPDIDVDDLLKIHYENLFGEYVSISALMNKIGIMQAEAENIYDNLLFDAEVYSAELKKRYRREANVNSGKFNLSDGNSAVPIKLTEDSLEGAVFMDLAYQNKKKAVINAKTNLSIIKSLYWSVQSKDKKLSVLMTGVTPSEFEGNIVDGVINGMLVEAKKDTWKNSRLINQ